jgi:hypothetical protein
VERVPRLVPDEHRPLLVPLSDDAEATRLAVVVGEVERDQLGAPEPSRVGEGDQGRVPLADRRLLVRHLAEEATPLFCRDGTPTREPRASSAAHGTRRLVGCWVHQPCAPGSVQRSSKHDVNAAASPKRIQHARLELAPTNIHRK